MTTETKKEETPKPDEAAILEKHKRGEELTPEEQEVIAGNPSVERSPEPAPADEGGEEEGDESTEEESPEGDEKPDEEEAGEEEPGAGSTSKPTDKVDEEAPASKEKPAAPAKPTAEETAKRRALIDAELEKSEDQADLSQFTEVELGLYFDLRRQRRRNQRIEQENRNLRLGRIKDRMKKPAEKPADEEPAAEEDPLKDRPEDDLVTVGEMRRLLAKKPKGAEKSDEGTETAPEILMTSEDVRIDRVEAENELLKKGIDDFSDVIEFAEAALKDDPNARNELVETCRSGGNVAKKTYYLIKASKHWPGIKKQLEAEKARVSGKAPEKKPAEKTTAEDNAARAKRIEKNAGKTKTTGPGGAGSPGTDEYTVEEIRRMSDREFARLPKKTQDAILRKYGSEPNYSV
jgi:hypothetical protein